MNCSMECGMYSCLLTCNTQYAEESEIEINDQAGSVSVAQAHLAPVTSQDDVEACMATLLQHNKIRSATHNILAYRIYVEDREAWLQVNTSCTWSVYTQLTPSNCIARKLQHAMGSVLWYTVLLFG